MSRSFRLIAFVVVLFAVFAGLTLRAIAQSGSQPAASFAETLPFGPGWAADYGTDDGLPPVPDYGSQPHGSVYSNYGIVRVRDYGSQPHGPKVINEPSGTIAATDLVVTPRFASYFDRLNTSVSSNNLTHASELTTLDPKPNPIGYFGVLYQGQAGR